VPLHAKAGDRIVVHGWPFDIGGWLGPRRWDVVVFKNPNEPDVNYIKRLIGLPGETIEIIDGDVFVKGPHDEILHSARKTSYAQHALWFPYYDHDYPPNQATEDWLAENFLGGKRWADYHPRWVALGAQAGWVGLTTRTPRFDGLEQARSEIQFVTQATDDTLPGSIVDMYGYNGYEHDHERKWVIHRNVTDVRLSVDVEIKGGDGYTELSISRYDDFFYARLYADGRLTLEHENSKAGQREKWHETRIPLPARPVRFALGHADYHVAVEIDGKTILESSPEQYTITPEEARRRSPLLKEQQLEQQQLAELERLVAQEREALQQLVARQRRLLLQLPVEQRRRFEQQQAAERQRLERQQLAEREQLTRQQLLTRHRRRTDPGVIRASVDRA
jgi:hypothetical protein